MIVALFIVVLATAVWGQAPASHDLDVVFVNEHPTEELQVVWLGPGDPKPVGKIGPYGGELKLVALEGQSYVVRSSLGFDRHVKASSRCSDRFSPEHWCAGHAGHTFFLLGVPDTVTVECRLQARRGTLSDTVIRIDVKPEWAPRGAARFLQLVREGFFDGVAITRVVPQLLAQFGLGTTAALRSRWLSATARILDDENRGIALAPGMMAFAAEAPNTRSTEVFFVLPNASPASLGRFGKSWETPFAVVTDKSSLDVISSLYSYGEIPPWGKGPDHARVISEGYQYLANEFQNLDHVESCRRTGGIASYDL